MGEIDGINPLFFCLGMCCIKESAQDAYITAVISTLYAGDLNK